MIVNNIWEEMNILLLHDEWQLNDFYHSSQELWQISPKYGLTNENSGFIVPSALLYVEQMANRINKINIVAVEFPT